MKIIAGNGLSAEHKAEIINGLNQNAFQKKEFGENNGAFSYALLDDHEKLLAGIHGFNFYGCCYIDLLYVDEGYRGKGYGSQLIQKAEETARKRSCLFMTVNTMDFEARPFYEKHGYQLEFTRSGFEKGSSMYFLRKAL